MAFNEQLGQYIIKLESLLGTKITPTARARNTLSVMLITGTMRDTTTTRELITAGNLGLEDELRASETEAIHEYLEHRFVHEVRYTYLGMKSSRCGVI